MAKKVVLKRLDSNNVVQSLYPQTSAEQVLMANGSTLETVLSDLIDRLDMDQIYITDSNDQIVTDGDTSATGLVAVY